jgi:hypothetical protein
MAARLDRLSEPLDPERRLTVSGGGRLDSSGPQRPSAFIVCPVCRTHSARLCAVRLQHGVCTVTYQCTNCGCFDDRLLQ